MPEPGRDATPFVKKRPTVALFPLEQQSRETLRDCFSQFGIDVITAEDVTVLKKEKLEGCVVSLCNPAVEHVVSQARKSPWQQRMVIYAVGPAANIRGLTQYGINVLLDSPVGRPAALKAIHATRLLLLNELRRYVRLPLAAPVALEYGNRHFNATSVEISAGGMSLECKEPCPPPETTLYASFAVPKYDPVTIASTVCWTEPKAGQFGLRFIPAAEGREAVKKWIEDYLGLD